MFPARYLPRTDARLVVSVVIFNPYERSCAYRKLCKGQHTVFVLIHLPSSSFGASGYGIQCVMLTGL